MTHALKHAKMKKERPKDTNTDFSKFTEINPKTSKLALLVRYHIKKYS